MWVFDDASGRVEAIDALSWKSEASLPLPGKPVALKYSKLSKSLYALDPAQGTLHRSAAGLEPFTRAATLKSQADLMEIDPSGRWIVVLNSRLGQVDTLDSSAHAPRFHTDTLAHPDGIGFSKSAVYLRSGSDRRVALVQMADLAKSESASMVPIEIDQKDPGAMLNPTRFTSFIPPPDGGSMIIAHASDNSIYFYAEGMMAPVGSHLNYGREPRAGLLLDRSLKEDASGRYVGPAWIDLIGFFRPFGSCLADNRQQ